MSYTMSYTMNYTMRYVMMILCCVLFFSALPFAQSQDSLRHQKAPTRALLWGIIPGGGQLYNKQVYKFPIIIGTGVAMGYFIAEQNRIYQTLLTSLSDPNREDDANRLGRFSERALRNGAEVFRRNRDYLIIITSLLYILQAVEAYVSAHLERFDNVFAEKVTTRLSMEFKPTVLPFNQVAYMYQIQWTL